MGRIAISPRNKTMTISADEKKKFSKKLYHITEPQAIENVINKNFNDNLFDVIDFLPKSFADLIIIDPPYNLDKDFDGFSFKKSDNKSYSDYLESWFPKVIELLKPNGSLYVCCDWKCSSAIYEVMSKHLKIRNRITWQREKGRGAKANWKNCTEDIWFATKSDDYYFDIDAVKIKRKVLAPYKENGKPKDWEETKDGNFRLTHPSNFWDDLTIPYWSMSENTEHPTQKPEKLIAKLILASCPKDGLVFDPFLGSGTTSVVAKKLGRNYCGVELNENYCLLAEKRLEEAKNNNLIQGYSDKVFWERNSLNSQKKFRDIKENGKSLFEVLNEK